MLSLALSERDSEMSKTLFDGFSRVINLVEKLKAGTRFIPRHTEMDAIDLQNLIVLIWDLSESAKQTNSLLTTVKSASSKPDKQLLDRLRLLEQRASDAWENIKQIGERSGVDQDIFNGIQMVGLAYSTEYFKARSRILASAGKPDQLGISDLEWAKKSDTLSDTIDKLGTIASSELKQLAQKAGAHGTRRLLIDTGIVIICLVIALVSLSLTKRIRHIAYHDSLTSLPNRPFFESELTIASRSVANTSKCIAVLYIDLDRFKIINDTFGHSVGDELLKETAKRLRELCPPRDMLARIGGDEFAMLVRDVTSEQQPIELAKSLIASVKEDMQVHGVKLKVGASVGVCFSQLGDFNGTELLKNADIAMFHAKTKGKEGICLFNNEIAITHQHRVQTEIDLKKAFENHQFELYYQPQVNVASGSVECVEALIRWHHPTRGLVPPDEFIPVAEDAGMLGEIGSWVLDEACQQLAVWHDAGLSDLRVAVNISPQQFAQEEFFAKVMEAIDRNELDPRYLELEVTEGVVMSDVSRVVDVLAKLRRKNIKIAVDDFGTGYSSLQYLQDLPLDTLKIDKAFIANLNRCDPFKSMANSIVQLGRAFDLDTVAEGIETEEQSQHVEALGVQFVQGYYYSKPVASDDVPAVIHRIESQVQDIKRAAFPSGG